MKLHFASEVAETSHLMAFEEQEYSSTFYTWLLFNNPLLPPPLTALLFTFCTLTTHYTHTGWSVCTEEKTKTKRLKHKRGYG